MHDHKPGKIDRILSCLCIPWFPMISHDFPWFMSHKRHSCGVLPGLVNIQKANQTHGHWNSEFSIVFPLNMLDLSSSQLLVYQNPEVISILVLKVGIVQSRPTLASWIHLRWFLKWRIPKSPWVSILELSSLGWLKRGTSILGNLQKFALKLKSHLKISCRTRISTIKTKRYHIIKHLRLELNWTKCRYVPLRIS